MEKKTPHSFDKMESVKIISTPFLARKMTRMLTILLLLGLICLFLPWTQNIRAEGEVTTLNPDERPQTIHSTIAGRIEKWHVQEGQLVKKGDTIVSLSEVKDKFFDPNFLSRIDEQIKSKTGALSSTNMKIDALKKQISALQNGLTFSLSKARNKVKQSILKVQSDSMDWVAMKIDNEIAKVQFERQEKLYKQGLKSLTEFEARKLKYQESVSKLISYENKFYNTKNDLLNSRIELNSIESEYLDKISKAESELNSTVGYYFTTEAEISKMNNEYSNMQIRSSFYQITAPQDGYITKALKSGIGETVKEGEAISTIMPSKISEAVAIYVRPMDIPLLEIGRKVRVQFDGWPALVFSGWPNVSFGTFGGVVKVIDNIHTKGKFRILVAPDPDDEPWPKQIRVGSGAYGWALLKDVPIWYELWREINGFPPDYIEKDTEIKSKAKEVTDTKEVE